MNKELAEYLKSKVGLTRLLQEFKKKYISLGRYSGTVQIEDVTNQERIDLSNLLGRRIEEHSNVKISFQQVTKKINEGKYRNFSWSEVFRYYFKEDIISNKTKEIQTNRKEEEFWQTFLADHRQSLYIEQIEKELQNKGELYKIFHQRYIKDHQNVQQELQNLLLLLDNIPLQPTSLSVYAALTGNPHYLDFNSTQSNLFFKVLSILKEEKYPITVQEKTNLLSEINVYTDPISNFVITYQIIGNPFLEQLALKRQVINLNLLNINFLDSLDTKTKKVFIFENPSILNALITFDFPIIITSGNPNLALYRVLEKLNDNNIEMYYNGDFDPEGLLIAEKLKTKFPQLQLLAYQEQDYERCKSQEMISASRLKKLDHIQLPELQVIKNKLLDIKLAGYQEKNIPIILKEIQKNIEK